VQRVTTRKKKEQTSPIIGLKIIQSYLRSQIMFFFLPT